MKNKLENKIKWVWEETLKIHKIAPETRIASSLSCIEIFVSLFYGGILKYNPEDEYWEDRDRLIISKGHGSISLYPILADCGYFDKDELRKVCCQGSFLGGIPDPIIPGYETVNGSLGHGLGVASGIAIALKKKKLDNSVFVMVGDGELYEGANWEAIMFAAHHQLDNLIILLDCNKISMLDYTDKIINHFSFDEKFKSFNWDIFRANGHNIDEVMNSLNDAKQLKNHKPKIIIFDTVKGKGVPDLENHYLSHVLTVKADNIDLLLKGKKDE